MKIQDAILGDPRLAADIRMNEVKGTLIGSRSRYLRAHWDDDVFANVADRLSSEARRYLTDPPAAFSWQAIAPLLELDQAIIEVALEGEINRMRPFGAEIAQYDLSNVYKLVIRLSMSPARMLKRIPAMYSQYFKEGSLSVEVAGNRGRLDVCAVVLPLYQCQFGFVGWIETALALAGGKGVRATPDTCRHRGDQTCGFGIEWA